jgi:hypothetical protein
VRRYSGSETVLWIGSYSYCMEVAADYNFRYQTDAAYVEAYDPEKANEWPT